MAEINTSITMSQGEGIKEIFTLEWLKEMIKKNELSIEDALKTAYNNALWDLEKACINKSRKMSTAREHTYYKAVGTHKIHECAEKLRKQEMPEDIDLEEVDEKERKGMGSVSSEVLAAVMTASQDTPFIMTDPKGDLDVAAARCLKNIKIMEKPYTEEEMRELQNEDGYVTGNVAISLSEIIDCDLEQFLDLCAIRLVDNECLMDINYEAIDIQNIDSGDSDIVIKVSGCVAEILEDTDDDEDEEE